MYSVWLALDYYKDINTDGNIVFIKESHRKFSSYYESYSDNNNKHLPIDYSVLGDSKKKKLKWVCANNIEPGDFFIFNCKTLHSFINNSTNKNLKFRFDCRIALLSHKDRLNEIFPNQSHKITSNNNNSEEIKENISIGSDETIPTTSRVTFTPRVKLSIE